MSCVPNKTGDMISVCSWHDSRIFFLKACFDNQKDNLKRPHSLWQWGICCNSGSLPCLSFQVADMKTITVGQMRHLQSGNEITLYEKKTGKQRKTNLNKYVVDAIQNLLASMELNYRENEIMGKKTIDTIEDKLGNLFGSLFEEGAPTGKKGGNVTEQNTENSNAMFHNTEMGGPYDIVEGQSGN